MLFFLRVLKKNDPPPIMMRSTNGFGNVLVQSVRKQNMNYEVLKPT